MNCLRPQHFFHLLTRDYVLHAGASQWWLLWDRKQSSASFESPACRTMSRKSGEIRTAVWTFHWLTMLHLSFRISFLSSLVGTDMTSLSFLPAAPRHFYTVSNLLLRRVGCSTQRLWGPWLGRLGRTLGFCTLIGWSVLGGAELPLKWMTSNRHWCFSKMSSVFKHC